MLRRTEVIERVARLEAVCRAHGVPLAAAALQFPYAHPAVATVLTGARSVDEVRENVASFERPIPAALWTALRDEGLLDPRAPVPQGLTRPCRSMPTSTTGTPLAAITAG